MILFGFSAISVWLPHTRSEERNWATSSSTRPRSRVPGPSAAMATVTRASPKRQSLEQSLFSTSTGVRRRCRPRAPHGGYDWSRTGSTSLTPICKSWASPTSRGRSQRCAAYPIKTALVRTISKERLRVILYEDGRRHGRYRELHVSSEPDFAVNNTLTFVTETSEASHNHSKQRCQDPLT
jgi:hypothetical protein